MTDVILVYVTTGSPEEAERIARALLDEHLIACANLLGGVKSFYRWRGNLEEATETLLLMKTRRPLLERLVERVRELHTYEVCEVLATPVLDGNPAYLEWVLSETASR